MKSLFKGYISVALMLAASLFASCGDDEKEEIIIDESEPTLEILSTETAFNFTSAGNSAKVLMFTTNREWQIVRGEGDSSWLTIFERAGKAGENIKVWIAVAENTATDGRGASFTLQSGGHTEPFTVYQAQKDAVVISDPEAYKNLSPEEQFIEVEFATNAGDFVVEYSFGTGAEQWIEQVADEGPGTRAMVSHKLRFKVAANESYSLRNASINISSKETEAKASIGVTQQGIVKPEITIANKDAFKAVPYAKTTLPLQLETNVENLDDLEVIIAENDQKWISCGMNEDETAYELTVEANVSSARSATIIVRSTKDNEVKDEVTLNQAAAPGVLITIKNKTVLAKELNKLGDNFAVEYEILVDDWDVAISYADPDQTGWVEETSRALKGRVMFKAYENKVLKPRTATIKLFSKTDESIKDEVTITQAAGTCVEIAQGKTLKETLEAYGLTESVESLELKGTLDKADLTLLKNMAKSTLKNLDLSAVTNTSFPESVFADCTKLETLAFPQHGNMTIIPAEVCRRSTALKEVRIPEGVEIIDHHAFGGCSSLTKIWLPSTITYLYGYCFEQCPVAEIHLRSKPVQVFSVWRSPSQPTVLATVFNNTNLPKRATLYVPSEYVELYKNPTPQNVVSKNLQDQLDQLTEWPEGWKGWFTWADATTVVNGEN